MELCRRYISIIHYYYYNYNYSYYISHRSIHRYMLNAYPDACLFAFQSWNRSTLRQFRAETHEVSHISPCLAESGKNKGDDTTGKDAINDKGRELSATRQSPKLEALFHNIGTSKVVAYSWKHRFKFAGRH